jgi:cytochrome c biogenesis protein CcmG/thiol:disulfide interchange protein DsbE
LIGLVAVLAAVLIYVVYGTLEPALVNAGDSAPDFKVVTEDGKTITPSSFPGKLLVLNFWASWCAPCVEETPSLNEFQKLMAPQGVVVLGVSVDKNEKLYHQFLQHFGIAFETSRDPDADIPASYGTFQFPDSYIIDPKGRVIEKIINAPTKGWMDPEFDDHIQKMLG